MAKHPWEENHWLPGILSHTQLEELHNDGYISNFDITTKESDQKKYEDKKEWADDWHESSVDLRLSDECWKMKKGSIKPFGKEAYRRILNNRELSDRYENNEDEHYQLYAGECYVFKLKERLTAKLKNIYGQATAKSSTGRLDVLARLIVDGESQYEEFESENLKDSTGELYLEVIPISFNIKVRSDQTLSQLRFFYGKPEDSEIKDEDFLNNVLIGSKDGLGYLSVDTTKTDIVGKKATAFISKKDDNEDNEDKFIDLIGKEHKPEDFWDIVESDKNNRLKIVKDKFYIIRSKERIAMPEGVAVYCRAIDESLGEMRIHYAGFVHPYFGLHRDDGKNGTPLIFEVRGHNVDVTLADGERLAKLKFYRMSKFDEWNEDKKPSYGEQELQLSKYFKDWRKNDE